MSFSNIIHKFAHNLHLLVDSAGMPGLSLMDRILMKMLVIRKNIAIFATDINLMRIKLMEVVI